MAGIDRQKLEQDVLDAVLRYERLMAAGERLGSLRGLIGAEDHAALSRMVTAARTAEVEKMKLGLRALNRR